MTLFSALAPLDLTPLRAALTHIDTDLDDADAVLAAASSAHWVSTSADLFRGQLADARQRITTISGGVAGVRVALNRVL